MMMKRSLWYAWAALNLGLLFTMGGCSPSLLYSAEVDGGGGGDQKLDSRSWDGASTLDQPGVADSVHGDADSGVTLDLGSKVDRTTPIPDLPAGSKCSTGGTGGAKQDLLAQSFKASNGLQSKYHLYADNLDWSKPVGLAVLLHGDGGSFYNHPSWAADEIIKVLRANNLLTITVLTPDTASDATWWKEGKVNIPFLFELIDAVVFKRYPIERDRSLLIGYSGGAEFITSFYLPAHGESFCGGGAILFGCGTPPWGKVSFSTAFKKSFKLHFYAGQAHEYLSNAKKGSAYYAALGFTVTTDFPAGVTHTSIPFATVVQGQMKAGILNH